MKKILGLEADKVAIVVADLNELLADFQVYYQTLRGLHWNIKGKAFFELHVKFEELYLDSQEKIDNIAERILTLRGTPLHTFQDYTNTSKLTVGKDIFKDEKAVAIIIDSIEKILVKERHLLAVSEDAEDEGTNAMMSDFISEQEKTLWMFTAWLS